LFISEIGTENGLIYNYFGYKIMYMRMQLYYESNSNVASIG